MSRRSRTNHQHLELRGRTYWVVKNVPPSLRQTLGVSKLRVNLKTSDLRQAMSKRYSALAQIEERLREARIGRNLDPLTARAGSIRDYDWDGDAYAHWDE